MDNKGDVIATDTTAASQDSVNLEFETVETKENEEYDHEGRCKVRTVVITTFSLLLFLYDFSSDIILAMRYKGQDQQLEFIFTLSFIIIPAVIFNVVSAYYTRLEDNWCSTVEVILTIPFMLGPFVRYTKTLYKNCRGEEKNVRGIQKHTALVMLLEAYLESVSQLVLQLYLNIVSDTDEDTATKAIRYASMAGSAIGLAWALVALRRTNRSAGFNESEEENILGTVAYFVMRTSEMGPRIILIALFTSQYTYFVFIIGGIHWVIMSLWTFIIDRTKEARNPLNIFLKLFIGYPMIFCYVDLDYLYPGTPREHSPTRYKMVVYYIIFYIENAIMFSLWVAYTPDEYEWFYPASIAITGSSMVAHILCLMMYHKFCHPNKENIQCCVKPEMELCLYK